MHKPRIALAHDYLNQYGGAERVVEVFHDLYPDAPVFTSIYDPEQMPSTYKSWDIRTSFLQRIPGIHRRHQPFLPLYPAAFHWLRVKDYDVVLSSSSAFGKGVRLSQNTLHICYCHSPMRFAWNFEQYAERERVHGLARYALEPVLARLRNWDRNTSRRVHHFIANSSVVAERIQRFWGRGSTVINPPVDTHFLRPVGPSAVEDYFLIVSRLVYYKRLDIVIEAFNQLGLPLRIVGDGRARSELEAMAGPNIEFLGAVNDEVKYSLYSRARAAVFPAEDDFGIAQVEAQAAGRPAIALAAGGALDTVIDGETGVHFWPQTADAIVDAVKRFDRLHFNTERITDHADGFNRARFQREIADFVDERYRQFHERRTQPAMTTYTTHEDSASWS